MKAWASWHGSPSLSFLSLWKFSSGVQGLENGALEVGDVDVEVGLQREPPVLSRANASGAGPEPEVSLLPCAVRE